MFLCENPLEDVAKLYISFGCFLQNSVLDEPITETVCIVADTDKWYVLTTVGLKYCRSMWLIR